jgi:hypothetical protein
MKRGEKLIICRIVFIQREETKKIHNAQSDLKYEVLLYKFRREKNKQTNKQGFQPISTISYNL